MSAPIVNFQDRLPIGKDSKICLVCDCFSDSAQDFADFVNICAQRRLEIWKVETPDRFEWEDDRGQIITVGNQRRNKAIFHLRPIVTLP